MGDYGLSGRSSPSVVQGVEILEDHVHHPAKCFPTLAAGGVVTAGVVPWTPGMFSLIMPANTVDAIFDIHRLQIEGMSTDGTYEMILFYGPSDIECSRVRFTRNNNRSDALNTFIQTNLIPANSQIRAKLASSASEATATFSLFYHTY